jgi:acetyl-CoA C-acetyltransferase
MQDVVIVAAARTPIGKLGGALASVRAVDLGAAAIREVLERTDTRGEDVSHVIFGTVLAADQGQVPSRQAALIAGIPPSVPSYTVNKVCASSLLAVNQGAQMIRVGDADIVVAGGMESMSRAPLLVQRFPGKLGDRPQVDSIQRDGLSCPVDDVAMGKHNDEVAAEYDVTREQQDEWAARSQQRYAEALEAGKFSDEIVPFSAGKVELSADEGPRPGTTVEALSKLRPVFSKDGTTTAGNAPGINDGGSAILLMSADRAAAAGLEPLGTWVSSGVSAAEHPYLATVPASAIQAAIDKTDGLVTVPGLDVVEINEAFAAVAITSTDLLGLDEDRVNVKGGAVAIGHPIGASGARILMTLLYELRDRGGGFGAAGICSGLAQGEATIVSAGLNKVGVTSVSMSRASVPEPAPATPAPVTASEPVLAGVAG